MKLSGSLPFVNRPPFTPVNADVLFNQLAKFAPSPFAIHWLFVVNRRRACDPVSVVPFTVPTPDTFRPLKLRSESGAVPAALRICGRAGVVDAATSADDGAAFEPGQ